MRVAFKNPNGAVRLCILVFDVVIAREKYNNTSMPSHFLGDWFFLSCREILGYY
jgi:hypothetical protein